MKWRCTCMCPNGFCTISTTYSDLSHHFLIDGYGIFPSLHHTISYTRTISAYNLCISVSFSFISTLHPVLYPPVSTLDSILPPSISMVYYIFPLFELTLTTFPTVCCIHIWFPVVSFWCWFSYILGMTLACSTCFLCLLSWILPLHGIVRCWKESWLSWFLPFLLRLLQSILFCLRQPWCGISVFLLFVPYSCSRILHMWPYDHAGPHRQRLLPSFLCRRFPFLVVLS